MKKKFFVDYDHETKTIFRISLASVTFLNLPFFFVNNSQINPFRYLLVFLASNIFYLFLFDKIFIQIKLLLMLRHPLIINYYSFINKKTCFLNSSFRVFVFFILFVVLSLFSKQNMIIFLLFLSAKFFWIFCVVPKFVYFALFFSSDFDHYFFDLKKKCIDCALKQKLIVQIEKSFFRNSD